MRTGCQALHAPTQPASHSVLNQLPGGSEQQHTPQVVRDSLDLIDRLSGPSQHLARFLLYSGVRLQEALNVRYGDVDQQGFILVRALKRSASRVIYYPDILDLINPAICDPSRKVFHTLNRWRFYRAIHATGFSKFQRSRLRRKLGNQFRVAAAEICRALGRGNSEAATRFLGHKNSRSTEFYRSQTGGLNGKATVRNPRPRLR